MAKKRKGTQAQAPQEVPLVTEVCSMDDIFPGFLQWQKEREARIREQATAVRVHPLEQGLFEAWKQAVQPLDTETIDRWNDIATHLTLPESWKLPPEMREKEPSE